MKDNEYKCSMCGEIYEKGWSDEEASAETEYYFGVKDAHSREDMAIICDDCFQTVHPKDNPDLVEKYKSK